MEKFDLNKKPSLSKCPNNYCFHWVPPSGSADMSGKSYDSFEKAIEASKKGVKFENGGCGCAFGLCKRDTGKSVDKDWYEPNNRILKKTNLPELFFCNPENLMEEDKSEYKLMARELWDTSA